MDGLVAGHTMAAVAFVGQQLSQFFILPGLHIPHLASKILSLSALTLNDPPEIFMLISE